MPDFEQIAEYYRGNHTTTAISPAAKRETALAVAASGVMADPNWKVYADHLAGLKKRFADIQVGQNAALLGAEVLAHEKYAQLKSDQAYAKGYVQAMTDAIDMIKELIDKPNRQS